MKLSALTSANTLKIAALVAVIVGVVALIVSGALDGIDAARIRVWIEGSGAMGPIIFMIALAVLQPLHVSVYVFLLTAVAVWEPWEALLYGWLGIQGAGAWSFLVSRHLARDFFERRMPDRVRPYLERMETKGFRTVLIMRLLFFTTPAVQWSYGLTPVRWRDFLLASAIGTVPTTAVAIFLGDALVAWWSGLTSGLKVGVLAVGALGVLSALLVGWLWRRRAVKGGV